MPLSKEQQEAEEEELGKVRLFGHLPLNGSVVVVVVDLVVGVISSHKRQTEI